MAPEFFSVGDEKKIINEKNEKSLKKKVPTWKSPHEKKW